MYDVYSCGFDGVIVRPKRVHKQIIFIFAKDFACPSGREDANRTNSGPSRVTLVPLWGQFGVTFGYLWVALRHLMVTLQSLWSHFGYTKVRFQKTLISPADFNDFIKLWN